MGTGHIDGLEKRLCFSTDGIEFVDEIDHPFMPVIPGATYIYRGADEQVRALRSRVTVAANDTIINGIAAVAVRERRYLEGATVADSYQYFAQDAAGNVWSISENDADSQIVVGAAGVLSPDQLVKTPFAHFADCAAIGRELYAPGIGLVQTDTAAGGFLRLAYIQLAPESFDDVIDNPMYPLTPGRTMIYRGVDEGVAIRLRVNVTGETKLITGVGTTVVRDRQYEAGELVEDTTSYYAQDIAGNVWFFGEDGEQIEDGVVVSTEGSWRAGLNGATPTLFMRAQPAVGDFYRLGSLPGVAEDETRVLRAGESIKVPFGSFGNTLVMEDASPLEPDDVELKYYVPGIGFIGEQTISGGDEVMRLAYVIDEPAS